MPKGTKVSRCVEKVKKSSRGVNPYAVCQASTGQSYATGKKLRRKKMNEETLLEGLYNSMSDMAFVIAEAFAGPIARKYGKKRMRSGGTERMKDPLVKAGAEEAQKRVDQRLGVRTNLSAEDAVQVAMNIRRRARKRGPGSSTEQVPGQAAAEQQSDFRKMAGDR